jgi:hypothetical protein
MKSIVLNCINQRHKFERIRDALLINLHGGQAFFYKASLRLLFGDANIYDKLFHISLMRNKGMGTGRADVYNLDEGMFSNASVPHGHL